MAATLVPDKPTFVNTYEQDVCRRLQRGLPAGSILLANLRITEEDQDLEADLVALVPGSGMAVVEVKGGRVWHEDQQWWQSTPEGPRRIDPFEQAMKTKRALIKYVSRDPRWSGGPMRWAHHVVLASTPLAPDFCTPQVPRWQVSGSSDLPTLVDQLFDNLELHHSSGALPPTTDQVRLIADILGGRFLPQRDVLVGAEARDEQISRLTDQQATLLQVTRLVPRVEIRGGAGSGKTHLAIEHARRLADGRLTGRPERVAVLCYSYGLAGYLRRTLQVGSRKKQPRFVGAFEELANDWGIDTSRATRDDSEFWERRLPATMAHKAHQLPDGKRFDAIIVDEAQDFADHWWTPLLHALADQDQGRLGIYSDEHQRVFNRFGAPPIQLVPLVLDHNLRNTQQIYDTFKPLAPSGMSSRGGTGPQVTFIPSTLDDAVHDSDDQVDILLDEGWRPHDIALLTVGKRHPQHTELQEKHGYRGYWDTYWDQSADCDVFYGHVLGFKGMERRAVVLCVNDSGRGERGAERLYVGLSRATDRLVVVGDPEAIERLGGPEVRRRLEAGETE